MRCQLCQSAVREMSHLQPMKISADKKVGLLKSSSLILGTKFVINFRRNLHITLVHGDVRQHPVRNGIKTSTNDSGELVPTRECSVCIQQRRRYSRTINLNLPVI